MNFYSGVCTIFTKNFEVAQITPEKYLSELKFSHDHEFDSFPVAGQGTEKLIFILSPPTFFQKI